MFDPRIGLAYALDTKTVARVYYGLIDYPGYSMLNEGTNASFYGSVGSATPTTTNAGITPGVPMGRRISDCGSRSNH